MCQDAASLLDLQVQDFEYNFHPQLEEYPDKWLFMELVREQVFNLSYERTHTMDEQHK